MTAARRALFDGSRPRWFTIPSHRPFVADLAGALYEAFAPDGPEALADAIILTPTRRGARALADAFVSASGGRAVLLPQIRAVGDLDEGEPPFEPSDLALDLPPAISPLRRRFELARLVAGHAKLFEAPIDTSAALELGDALAAFLDSVQIEEARTDRLGDLVEGELAKHWQVSAEFLQIATELWPRRLADLGLVDVSERQIALLKALAAQWRAAPPDRPLIAAGSTGTAPAMAELLGVIAEAPLGAVVLPGLDLSLAEDAWAQVGEAHPQGAMKRLLDRHGLSREAVQEWPRRETIQAQLRGRSRRRIINEALRPAEATADWRRQIDQLRAEAGETGADPIAEGLEGLSIATARTEEEAATVVALLLREALETPGKTAALVTPDPGLSRRVAAKLSRWAVDVDVSAGQPLTSYPVGALIALAAQATAKPLDPAITLAVLKHPLVRLGREERELDRPRRLLERYGLRGGRPRTWTALRERLAAVILRTEADQPGRIADLESAIDLALRLETALELAAIPFAGGAADPVEAARALVFTLEALARDDTGRTGGLWAGAGGEAAASFLAALLEDGAVLPPCTAAGFSDLIERLLGSQIVRTGGATHPHLRILGAIEARLIRADRLVLAGLEEGVWPQAPPTDPFLSRPMRARLGLPAPERRIGLSAHDFAQAACAPEVVLVHTERRGGQPAVMSRWLWRLTTLTRGASLDLPRRDDAVQWARALDAPITAPPASLKPAGRPKPKPPVEVRPRKLPVTRIETWVRDPYAVYARHVLALRKLDRPDALFEASARGSAVHRAFERFALACPQDVPPGAAALIERFILEALDEAGHPEPAMARERPLAVRLSVWAAGFEAERRAASARLVVEQEGSFAFDGPAGLFTVTAKADRIELCSGLAHVLDFKTGQPPSKKQIETGFAPQLTLTGAILRRGGFADVGAVEPGELAYVRLTGRKVAGELMVRAGPGESVILAETAFEGLIRRVAMFDDPGTPYAAWAAPQFLSERAGDYDHLSRLWEWHVMGGEAEAGE